MSEDDDIYDYVSAMVSCPYYRGAGTCVTGCSQEPACITGEPDGGWVAGAHHAPAAFDIPGYADMLKYVADAIEAESAPVEVPAKDGE